MSKEPEKIKPRFGKKHYLNLARVIKAQGGTPEDSIVGLLDILERGDKDFSREKFLEACNAGKE